MNKNELYNRLLDRLKNHLKILFDKPEETYEASLKALWLLAYGMALSADQAVQQNLPDLNPEQVIMLEELVEKRLKGVPLAHLTKRQQFMGIELIANEKALIPRKETEILGNLAVEMLKQKRENKSNLISFDICCGAGNLAVAMAKLVPEVIIYASDLSEEAISLTNENIRFHHLHSRIKAFAGDLLEPFNEMDLYNKVDLIVCNPPYISDYKISRMPEEISQYEPELAFKGGGLLGLSIIQNMIKNAERFLTKNGVFAFEIGLGQADYLLNFAKKTKLYRDYITRCDLEGNIRVLGLIK